MPKSFKDLIIDGIKAEQEAINFYTFLLSFEPDGNDRRSWQHALNEEKDHKKLLENKLKKLNRRV